MPASSTSAPTGDDADQRQESDDDDGPPQYAVVCECGHPVVDTPHRLRVGAEIVRDVHNGLFHTDDDASAEVIHA